MELEGSIQHRGQTSAEWLADTTPPLSRQLCVETDTGQAKFGDGVSEWSDLPYIGTASTSDSRLISGGGITVVSDDITVAEAEYYISGFGSFIAPETAFNNITLSAPGNQRFVAFYGKTDSTMVKVEGSEGAVASMPDGPANSILINYSLVTDGAIGSGIDLSGYLLRSDKATPAEVATGTDDTKYITPYALENSGVITSTGYCLQWSFPQFSPADSTTYFFGAPIGFGPNTGNTGGRDIGIARDGTIKAVAWSSYVNGTLGTSENTTLNLVVVNSTGVTVSTNLIINSIQLSATFRRYYVSGLSISVTAGQYIIMQLVTPAYATNPTNLWANGSIYIE